MGLVLINLCFLFSTLAWAGHPDAKNLISVTAQAEKEVAPDEAIIKIEFSTEDKTSKKASRKVNESVTEFKSYLKRKRISSVETLQYGVHQLFDWNRSKRVFRAYQARHILQIKTSELEKVGDVLTHITQYTNSKINGTYYRVKEIEEVQNSLLKKAAAKAYIKAQSLASGAGASIRRLHRINESNSGGNYPRHEMAMMDSAPRMMKANSATAPTQVFPRLQKIKVNVSAQYELK